MPRETASSGAFNPATAWQQLLAPMGVPDTAPHADRTAIEASWQAWLTALLPRYLSTPEGALVPFGEHHTAFWDWVWALRRGATPPALVAIWPRGGGKSTSAELAGAMVGALGTRKYVLYVCETLERAEDHVGNVAAMFESPDFARYYPDAATRMLSKYGNSKGWKRNRLRTAGGFTVDAIGLDVAARGAKIEEVRPDLLIIDDVDGTNDSPEATRRKIATLTRTFLPAGAADLAVLFVQNLIHRDSIASRLAGVSEHKADFLQDRIVSGPFPALRDMAAEERDGRWVITAGTPIWAGMDLARCQRMVEQFGLTAFRSESQQEVDDPDGGMFGHLDFRHCRADQVPDLVRVVVWVDPAVTATDQSDAHGIQADGIAADGIIYRIWSWERRATPEESLERAILKAVELGADSVGVETDQGGDTWQVVYRSVWDRLRADGRVPDAARMPRFKAEKAGGGHGPKAHRASQMLADYERGRFVHVLGTHEVLERGLRRFPGKKPFDLVDAAFWCWHDLTGGSGLPFAWLRNDPEFVATVPDLPETPELPDGPEGDTMSPRERAFRALMGRADG